MLLRGRAWGSGLRHGHREHYGLPTWLEAAGTRIVLHALKKRRNQKNRPPSNPIGPDRGERGGCGAVTQRSARTGLSAGSTYKARKTQNRRREIGAGRVRVGVGTVPCDRGRTDGRADGPPKSSASGSSSPPAAFTPRPERRERRRRSRRETRGRPRAADGSSRPAPPSGRSVGAGAALQDGLTWRRRPSGAARRRPWPRRGGEGEPPPGTCCRGTASPPSAGSRLPAPERRRRPRAT